MAATESVLEMENVTVAFEAPVLKDVSLVVRPGETVVLLGAAGSGKSVLLKTAIGLIAPVKGRVKLLGQVITGMSEEEQFPIRARVGILFQEGALFDSLTIEENVAYPLAFSRNPPPEEEIKERVRRALEFVELEHTLEKYPSELSGGMRRRVGIARANVTEPDLVLYDSPTAGLDPITSYTIMSLIAKERDVRNVATVIVTHRYQDGHLMANFRYNPKSGRLEPAPAGRWKNGGPTRFLVLAEGRLVFDGSQSELEASADPYISKFVKRN